MLLNIEQINNIDTEEILNNLNYHIENNIDIVCTLADSLSELSKQVNELKKRVIGKLVTKLKEDDKKEFDLVGYGGLIKKGKLVQGRVYLKKSKESVLQQIKYNISYSDDQLYKVLFDEYQDTIYFSEVKE